MGAGKGDEEFLLHVKAGGARRVSGTAATTFNQRGCNSAVEQPVSVHPGCTARSSRY